MTPTLNQMPANILKQFFCDASGECYATLEAIAYLAGVNIEELMKQLEVTDVTIAYSTEVITGILEYYTFVVPNDTATSNFRAFVHLVRQTYLQDVN